jgi:hypothetical protein
LTRSSARPRTPTTRPSFDGNVQPAAIAAQQAGRRYPGINLVRDQPVTRCRSTRTGQPSPGSCGVLTPKCHRRCVPPCRRRTRETSGHTRGQAFGIGALGEPQTAAPRASKMRMHVAKRRNRVFNLAAHELAFAQHRCARRLAVGCFGIRA